MSKEIDDLIDSRRKRRYRALKEHDSAMYRDVIGGIEAVTLTHGVETHVAADYESAAVSLVCGILGLKP